MGKAQVVAVGVERHRLMVTSEGGDVEKGMGRQHISEVRRLADSAAPGLF